MPIGFPQRDTLGLFPWGDVDGVCCTPLPEEAVGPVAGGCVVRAGAVLLFNARLLVATECEEGGVEVCAVAGAGAEVAAETEGGAVLPVLAPERDWTDLRQASMAAAFSDCSVVRGMRGCPGLAPRPTAANRVAVEGCAAAGGSGGCLPGVSVAAGALSDSGKGRSSGECLLLGGERPLRGGERPLLGGERPLLGGERPRGIEPPLLGERLLCIGDRVRGGERERRGEGFAGPRSLLRLSVRKRGGLL